MHVDVREYDPAWADAFLEVREELERLLEGVPVEAIEHVGSTSVPGLAAKPVLDIDIVVTADALVPAIEALGRGGYEHRGDLGISDRHAFREPDSGPKRNVYVVLEGSLSLRNHLAVRDVLRRNDALRDEYGALKLQLASEDLDSMFEYIARKSPVVQRILEAAGLSDAERAEIAAANEL